jgi:hypothetical protein
MSTEAETDDRHVIERLYGRIWLLALLAMIFWTLSYVAWGAFDVLSVG